MAYGDSIADERGLEARRGRGGAARGLGRAASRGRGGRAAGGGPERTDGGGDLAPQAAGRQHHGPGQEGSRGIPDRGGRGQAVEPAELTLLADRTPPDVEPGHAQHEGPGRLRRLGWRRRGLGQEGTALGELRRAMAVGEQAEVADADEAVGDDVQEEAAEELLGSSSMTLTRSPSA